MSRRDVETAVAVLTLQLVTRVLLAEIDYSTSSTSVAVSSIVPVSNITLLQSATNGIPEALNASLFSTNDTFFDNSTNSETLMEPEWRSISRSENDTGIWTQVTSTYSRITTEFSPFRLLAPKIEKRGMGNKQMMKMMKKTNMMNAMANMMNAMMKYKSECRSCA